MESIEQTFNGSVGLGNRVTATISRNGDLVHRMWLQAVVKMTNAAAEVHPYPENVGHQLVKEVEVEIGGQKIDKQYADWMEMWSQLTVSSEHATGYATMVGDALASANGNGASHTLYVPLQFWFCRNPGLALPLIALQYHEVKVNLTFGSLIVKPSANGDNITPSLTSASLWVDYIYLDTDERRRFAQVSHEYLIEQVQHTGDEAMTASTTNNVRLNFNHPVKELVWAQIDSAAAVAAAGHRFGSYEALSGDTKLQLNGHDRMAARPAAYFNQVQTYQHHTNIPSGNVYVYSFALKPEEHQPSGTCNFSRIDNATLSVGTGAHASVLKVFAVNYNVLRVMSGMGGLAYSN
jgi:hypothetical protein